MDSSKKIDLELEKELLEDDYDEDASGIKEGRITKSVEDEGRSDIEVDNSFEKNAQESETDEKNKIIFSDYQKIYFRVYFKGQMFNNI